MFPPMDDPRLYAHLRRRDAVLDQALAAADARGWEGTLAAGAQMSGRTDAAGDAYGARQAAGAIRRQLMDRQRALRYPPAGAGRPPSPMSRLSSPGAQRRSLQRRGR
jgi:hypothetical protein